MRLRIRHWQIEYHQRSLYIQQQPNPNCPDCEGHGSVETGGHYVLDHVWDADLEPCPCWDPFHTIRVPLWRRQTEAWPF